MEVILIQRNLGAICMQLINILLQQLQTHKFQAQLNKAQLLNQQQQVLKTHNLPYKIKLLIYQLFKFLILYLYLALMENVLIYSA